MVSERRPVVLACHTRCGTSGSNATAPLEPGRALPRVGGQREKKNHQRAVVFAVSHQRHGDAHPQPRPAAVFGKPFESQQKQRRGEHQRPVGHGDEAVELEHQRRGRHHDEQRGVAAAGIRRADQTPQNPKVEGLQHGEEKPHAQLPAEETLSGPDQQRRHGRMVKPPPCEAVRRTYGSRLYSSLASSVSRPARVCDPPHPEPQKDQPVGPQRGV